MKTLKLALAWLDWSTYCKSSSNNWTSNYKFPASLCSLFWKTLLSLAALPITWITHIWNLLFIKKEYFVREAHDEFKANLLNTLIITILTLAFGMVTHGITDGTDGEGLELGWDLFHESDPMILNYFKLLLAGIVFEILLAIVLLTLFWIGYIGYLLIMFSKNKILKKSEKDPNKTEETQIAKLYKAIKDKYCPMIDWRFIKDKEKNK